MLYPLPEKRAGSFVAVYNIPIDLRESYQRAGLNIATVIKNLVSLFFKKKKRMHQAFKSFRVKSFTVLFN